MADSEWPALMGMDAQAARATLHRADPTLVVHVVPEDAAVTMDFNEKRVRLFVDAGDRVTRVPRVS
ncbi:serine protease inhibitor [Streptomyces sp. NPDC002990]